MISRVLWKVPLQLSLMALWCPEIRRLQEKKVNLRRVKNITTGIVNSPIITEIMTPIHLWKISSLDGKLLEMKSSRKGGKRNFLKMMIICYSVQVTKITSLWEHWEACLWVANLGNVTDPCKISVKERVLNQRRLRNSKPLRKREKIQIILKRWNLALAKVTLR